MKAVIVTTIRTTLDITTFKKDTTVEVECDDELPEDVVVAAAIGGVKGALAKLESL